MNIESDRTESLRLSRHPRWSSKSFPIGNERFRCFPEILEHIFKVFQVLGDGPESLRSVVSPKGVTGGIVENQAFEDFRDFDEYDHIWRTRRHRTDQIILKNMKFYFQTFSNASETCVFEGKNIPMQL